MKIINFFKADKPIDNTQSFPYQPIVMPISNDIQNRKNDFRHYQSLLIKLYEIFMNYSESLLTLPKNPTEISNPSQKSSTKTMVQMLLLCCKQQGKKAQQLAKKIQKEIIPGFKGFNDINQANIDLYTSQALKLQKQLMNQLQIFSRFQNSYLKQSEKNIELKYLVLSSELIPNFDRIKKNSISIDQEQTAKNYVKTRKQYLKRIEQTNDFIVNQSKILYQLVEKIAENQKIRVNFMQNCLKKFFGFKQPQNQSFFSIQLKKLANNQAFQLPDPVIAKIYDPMKVQEYYQRLKKKDNNLTGYVAKIFQFFIDKNIGQKVRFPQQQLKGIDQLQRNVQQLLEDIISKVIEHEKSFQPRIILIFRNLFVTKMDIEDNMVAEFQQLIKNSPQNRKIFLLCLKNLDKMLTKLQCCITFTRLDTISLYLKIFLNHCMEQKDSINATNLMLDSCHISFTKQNGLKQYLYQLILHHPIWRDKKYWQCACLQYMHQCKKPTKSEILNEWDFKIIGYTHNPIDAKKIRGTLINQINQFITKMVLFKVPPTQIRNLTNKFKKLLQFTDKDLQNCYKFIEHIDNHHKSSISSQSTSKISRLKSQGTEVGW